MAKAPRKYSIADVLGFGAAAPRSLASGLQREYRRMPRNAPIQGGIKATKPTATQELVQLLTPNTRVGNEFANKLAPAVDMSPIGVLTGLVDARRAYQAGNTGQAAGLGILAALGAIPGGKGVNALNDIRKASDDVYQVMEANTTAGRVIGDKMLPISFLKGGVSNAADDAKRVNQLVKQMSSPEGYISRLIVDDAGNVIEGQHRLEALRKLGVKEVPVTQYMDLERAIPFDKVKNAALNSQEIHPDQANQIAKNLAEIYADEGGNMDEVLLYSAPRGFEKAWDAAIKVMIGGK